MNDNLLHMKNFILRWIKNYLLLLWIEILLII